MQKDISIELNKFLYKVNRTEPIRAFIYFDYKKVDTITTTAGELADSKYARLIFDDEEQEYVCASLVSDIAVGECSLFGKSQPCLDICVHYFSLD